MSTRTKLLLPVFLIALGVAACGESPTSPTSPLPPVQSEPWGGSTGVLWAHRSDPVRAVRTAPAGGEGSEASVAPIDTSGRSASREAGAR